MPEPPEASDKPSWLVDALRPIGTGAIYVAGGVSLLMALAVVFALDDLMRTIRSVVESEISFYQKVGLTALMFVAVGLLLSGIIGAALCAMKKTIEWSKE